MRTVAAGPQQTRPLENASRHRTVRLRVHMPLTLRPRGSGNDSRPAPPHHDSVRRRFSDSPVTGFREREEPGCAEAEFTPPARETSGGSSAFQVGWTNRYQPSPVSMPFLGG